MAEPQRFSTRAANYLQQLHAAGEAELAFYQDLRDKGWEYDEPTRRWTHPDHPGAEIMEG